MPLPSALCPLPFALRLALCPVPFALVLACSSGPPPPVTAEPYEAQVLAARAEIDAMFKFGDQSPLLPDDRAAFAGLPYFPIDAAYRVPASLTPDPSRGQTIIELPTSTSQMRRMRQVGTLGFRLHGQQFTLTAYADVNARTMDRLFVPFGDLTNKDATYGGGRYLDLDRTPTGLYDLDFNRAYHPYCVFNISYECPVPPPENRLNVAIEAGERLANAMDSINLALRHAVPTRRPRMAQGPVGREAGTTAALLLPADRSRPARPRDATRRLGALHRGVARSRWCQAGLTASDVEPTFMTNWRRIVIDHATAQGVPPLPSLVVDELAEHLEDLEAADVDRGVWLAYVKPGHDEGGRAWLSPPRPRQRGTGLAFATKARPLI